MDSGSHNKLENWSLYLAVGGAALLGIEIVFAILSAAKVIVDLPNSNIFYPVFLIVWVVSFIVSAAGVFLGIMTARKDLTLYYQVFLWILGISLLCMIVIVLVIGFWIVFQFFDVSILALIVLQAISLTVLGTIPKGLSKMARKSQVIGSISAGLAIIGFFPVMFFL